MEKGESEPSIPKKNNEGSAVEEEGERRED